MTIKQNGGIFGRNPTLNDVTVDGSLQVSGSNENSLFYSDADGNLQTSTNLTWDTGALGALNVGAQAYIQTTSSTNAETGGSYGKILYYKSGSGIGALDFYCYSGGLVKRMELDKTGHLTLTNGNLVVPSGNGIDFSATSGTGTSELFDDYEEGTWTPDIQDTSGNSASVGSTIGLYTKIGDVVTAFIRVLDVNTSGLTAGDAIRVYGLPYTAAGVVRYTNSAVINTWTGTTGLNLLLIGGNDYAQFKTPDNGNALVSEITSGSADIYAQVTYKV